MPFIGISWAAVAATTTVAAAGVSAYSQVQQGKAAKQSAAYNQAVANNNAILMQQQARNESAIAANNALWLQYQQQVANNQARGKQLEAETLRQSSEENLKRRRDDYRRILSRQRAQFAKSGVAMAGTAIEVLAESATRMELEAQEVANQTRAGMESMFYEAELIRAGAQAKGADAYMAQWQARNALTTGQYRADLTRSGAAMDMVAARNQATSYNLGAASTLLSSGGQAYRQYK